MNNLLTARQSRGCSETARLHDMLTRKLVEAANLPLGFSVALGSSVIRPAVSYVNRKSL